MLTKMVYYNIICMRLGLGKISCGRDTHDIGSDKELQLKHQKQLKNTAFLVRILRYWEGKTFRLLSNLQT